MPAASTKDAGSCFAFPDVCADALGIPLPLPNLAECADADVETCARRVKILNKPVMHRRSIIARSSGDEAGVGKGVVSGTQLDRVGYRSSEPRVLVEGHEIVTHLCETGHNGSNVNAPNGTQVSPSQALVLVGEGGGA